jgi:hypothetical protein
MGHMLIVRSREAVLAQARRANDALQASSAKNLNEFADVNYEQFCLLIEALHTLGATISQDLLDRAQMRPIDEAF